MSASSLEQLASKAARLAEARKRDQPNQEVAIEAGVKDDSYSTVRYGVVPSFSGEATVTMDDGSTWLCVGHGPQGNAETVKKDGYIEMIRVGL